jgi:hypothetical protein
LVGAGPPHVQICQSVEALEMMSLKEAILVANRVLGTKSIIKNGDRLIKPLSAKKGLVEGMVSY